MTINPQSVVPTSIVTHNGKTHRDDFLSVSIALHVFGDMPVYRREPTEDELNNPKVLVLDVGGRHEPKLNNFDHHQFERDSAPRCALSLLLSYLGWNSTFEFQKWYAPTIEMDSKGPFQTRTLGIDPSAIFALQSPVELAMLQLFENVEEVPLALRQAMAVIGKTIIDIADKYGVKVANLRYKCERVSSYNVGGILLESSDNTGLQDYRDKYQPDAGFSICHDDRGEGWTLYRFNDDERIDFSQLEGHPDILFAHKGGFIAKTKTRLSEAEVIGLVGEAVTEHHKKQCYDASDDSQQYCER